MRRKNWLQISGTRNLQKKLRRTILWGCDQFPHRSRTNSIMCGTRDVLSACADTYEHDVIFCSNQSTAEMRVWSAVHGALSVDKEGYLVVDREIRARVCADGYVQPFDETFVRRQFGRIDKCFGCGAVFV